MTRDDALTGRSERFLYARARTGRVTEGLVRSVMTRHLGSPDPASHWSKPAWPKGPLKSSKNFRERLTPRMTPPGRPRFNPRLPGWPARVVGV
jgi:hypothetical protein